MNNQSCSNITDISTFHLDHKILFCVIVPILFVSGVIGNTLGAIVSSSTKNIRLKLNKSSITSEARSSKNYEGTSGISPSDAENSRDPSVETKSTLLKDLTKVPPQRISNNNIRRKKKRFNANQFLLKWFFLVNLFNVGHILPIRIIDALEAQRMIKLQKRFGTESIMSSWITGYGWNYYMANYHIPICKSFVTLGSLVYVLFFMNQMVAIKFPFSYEKLFTKNRLRLAIAFCFFYCFLWYLPTIKWFDLIKIPICDNVIPSFDVLKASNLTSNSRANLVNRPIKQYFIYNYSIRREQNSLFKRLWAIYQILRELFTKILPFLSIMLFKSYALRKTKNNFLVQNLDGIRKKPIINSNKDSFYTKYIRKNGFAKFTGTMFSNKNDRQKDSKEMPYASNIPLTNEPAAVKVVPSYVQKLERERKQHKQTMFILTIEFIIFLLPISIMQMTTDYMIRYYNNREVIIFHNIFNVLEFVYISWSFFLNFAFNPIYRLYVYERLRTL
ncbi:unnamed protein product [Gordionus sp. m RMFG-2023]